MPLLIAVSQNATDLIQVAFADDLTGVGSIVSLKKWWYKIGPYLGYLCQRIEILVNHQRKFS